MSKGKLYMIPCPIGDGAPDEVLSAQVIAQIHALDYFLVENLKSGRRFVSGTKPPVPVREQTFEEFNKRTDPAEISRLLNPLKEGRSIGVISEAGCPGVADPGALLVEWAHQKGFEVVPLIGPSSFLLALMASGLNGQSFAFHGYLPKDANELKKQIQFLEGISAKQNQTQLFMDTPYRTDAMVKVLIENCKPTTILCVAANLNTSKQKIISQSIGKWQKSRASFGKVPAVFLIQA